MKKYLTVLLLVFILIPRSKAAHIIGGEMYYECLGYGKDSTFRKYLITIKLYRDCRPQQNAAGFDRPLGFSIYRKIVLEMATPRSGGMPTKANIPFRRFRVRIRSLRRLILALSFHRIFVSNRVSTLTKSSYR